MVSRKVTASITILAGCVVLTGCMPKMTIEEMKAMKPDRPAELDRLNVLVGEWEHKGISEFKGLDQPLQSSGTQKIRWEGDKWYLVSENTFTMGELGDMEGMEIWTYDTHSDCFRVVWVGTDGWFSHGRAWYDEGAKQFKIKGTDYSPHGKMSTKGTLTVVDHDTLVWEWEGSVMAGLMEVVEMEGTAKRK